ncbi:poly-gamma-glutamate hydrolase family protein [Streptomyces sp. NPDC051582]|uniref:poly-gamma-glutamate hydrolase family protein n=1 Tax=Streptomyces sp. NPDC051582 TaxID=3155167 RepID=UPI003449F414
MKFASRRSVLASAAATLATLPLLNDLAGNGSTATAVEVPTIPPKLRFSSNTHLYTSPDFKEGTDWMRRFRCGTPQELGDNLRATSTAVRSTAVLAPHGGGIEAGTSELCLAIAGYSHKEGPASAMPAAVPGLVQRDYWMFESLISDEALHITSTDCDDPAALAVCSNNLYAVSLHGFSPKEDSKKKISKNQILIGGRDRRLMANLAWAFDKYGLGPRTDNDDLSVEVTVAAADSELNGDDEDNFVNRTRTRAGAQLEISTELRRAMFGTFDGAENRRATAGTGNGVTTKNEAHFWNGFTNAVREAIDVHELGLAKPAPSTA